jgi:hypothetical protein
MKCESKDSGENVTVSHSIVEGNCKDASHYYTSVVLFKGTYVRTNLQAVTHDDIVGVGHFYFEVALE